MRVDHDKTRRPGPAIPVMNTPEEIDEAAVC